MAITHKWEAYLDAARRKIQIASYHAHVLEEQLAQNDFPLDGRPPISVQASFEGVVFAVIAAIDQVAQAVNSALKLGLSSGELFEGVTKEIEVRVPEFRSWRNDPMGLDLRRLRTRMAHYSYQKRSAKLIWEVESANEAFVGSRELASYAKAAVAYAHTLESFLDSLTRGLSSR